MCGSRFFSIIAIAAAMWGLATHSAEAAGKSVKVCNYTNGIIFVAIGWLDYGFPSASGYMTVPSAGCKTAAIAKADSYLPVYAYAQDAEGNAYRPKSEYGGLYFCIDRAGGFSEKSSTICKAKDEAAKTIVSDWELFQALGLPIADAYFWNVN